MRNIALKLMYNGTAYHGWQVQKNAVTVCGTLEKAIADICGGPVHLTAADAPTPVSTRSTTSPTSARRAAFPWTGSPSPSTPTRRRTSR